MVDVQAALLDQLVTRAVIPLLPSATAPPPLRELRRPVALLARKRDAITRALDSLFLGY